MPRYGLRSLKRDTRGANFAEYLIIVAIVAIAGIAALRLFGTNVDSKVQAEGDCIQSMTSSCGKGNGATDGTGAPNRTAQIEQAAQAGEDDDDGGGGIFGFAKKGLSWLGGQAKNAIEGAVLGSWGGNNGWAGRFARIAVGFIPIVGQIADARDTIWAIKNIIQNPTSGKAWMDLGVAGIGWVPGVGDAVKESIRSGQQIAKLTKGLGPFIAWGQRAYGVGNQAVQGEPASP